MKCLILCVALLAGTAMAVGIWVDTPFDISPGNTTPVLEMWAQVNTNFMVYLVKKTGDTMTGELKMGSAINMQSGYNIMNLPAANLAGDAISFGQAKALTNGYILRTGAVLLTNGYVSFTTANSTYVNAAGDTITGNLVFDPAPIAYIRNAIIGITYKKGRGASLTLIADSSGYQSLYASNTIEAVSHDGDAIVKLYPRIAAGGGGTAFIDASSVQIKNLATATADTDAVNLGQAKALTNGYLKATTADPRYLNLYGDTAGLLTVSNLFIKDISGNVSEFGSYGAIPFIKMDPYGAGAAQYFANVGGQYGIYVEGSFISKGKLAIANGTATSDAANVGQVNTAIAGATNQYSAVSWSEMTPVPTVASALTVQLKDASGNNLSGYYAIELWTSSTTYGAPTKYTDADSVATGTVIKEHTTDALWTLQTDNTGKVIVSFTRNAVGTLHVMYSAPVLKGKIYTTSLEWLQP